MTETGSMAHGAPDSESDGVLPWRCLVAVLMVLLIVALRRGAKRGYFQGLESSSTLLGGGLMLLTAVLATVNRVLYKVALVPLGDYVFFLAQFTTFGYVFAYWSALLINRSRGAVSDGQLRFAKERWQTFASIGALEAGSVLLGMLSAKSLPGEILPVLSKLFLVFQMIFSRLLLQRSYSQSQLSGCALCVLGVIASAGSSLRLRSFGASPALLFVLSLALPALASVLKEKLFADARAQLKEELNVFVVNTLGSSGQAVCVLLLLPVLAELQGVGDIGDYLQEGAEAFGSSPIWPCFYLATNLLFNVSVLTLLRTTSAVSVSLAMALAVPITAVAFASCDIPLLGPGQPLDRFFGFGLILIIAGLCLYHGWLKGAVGQVSTSGSPAALAAPGSAEELIASIRREEFGFEGEQLSGGALQVKQNARLARALKRLAGELYGSDVHWQLELLQNADDNMYKEGVTPSAEFLLRESNGGEVLFRCNEVGFREADIRAICDIGNSSKVGVAKYGPGGRVVATGEKGLGFKAVFALTDKPKLFSGPYRLEFDATHPSGIGYVLPRWLEEKEDQLLRPSWGSLLRLPLRPELHPRREELFRRLAEALPPSLLLFMKRLQEVSVRGETGGTSSLHVKYAEEQPTGAENRWKEFFGQVKLQVSRDGGASWEMEHWLLLRRHVKVPEGLAKPGIAVSPPSTLLEMALPLDDQGGFQAGRGAQQVFAFLPVRSYGLPFALQADWAVSSSREEILSGCAWNEFLKAELPNLILTLVSSVTSLNASDPLKWSFYSAVPAATSASNFFRPAIVQLQNKLRGVECMLTDEDSFCLPQKAIRCPPEARRCLGPGSPLQQALRSQGLHLLHEKVEAYAPAGLLDSLGVLRLNASQLLRLLPNVEDFPGMSWWRQLLALLDELLDLAPKNDLARLVEVARKLPLLPVQGASLEVSEGLVLPPEQPEAEGFPPELLAELRAVDFRSASNIIKVADKMVELGFLALGYEYLVIDDCWASDRGEDGVLIPDPAAFPDGMKAVADYVHSKGLKFGIYTDRGYWTCAGRPGSAEFEEVDAKTFVQWEVDYVKTDSCNGPDSLEDQPSHEAIRQYELFRDALSASGRPVYLALSGWHNWYSPYGASLANSWRVGYDVRNWKSAWNFAIRVNAFLASFAGPGGWNDPDMLVGSSEQAKVRMTPQQSRTQFSLWSVMAAPLLIGSSMLSMSPHDVETYSNKEVIAVDQDALGIQGQIVWENCPLRKRANIKQKQFYEEIPSCQQVWARPLSGGKFAVVLLNLNKISAEINFRISDVCWSGGGCAKFFESATLRDLWAKKDLGVQNFIKVTLPPDGASRMFKLKPVYPPASKASKPSKNALHKAHHRHKAVLPYHALHTDTVHFLQTFTFWDKKKGPPSSPDKDHGDSELEEGAGALAVARVRKLLRRLNVAALTPRMVVKDILAPLFGSEGQVPRVIAASEAPRSLSALLALGGFLVTHRHLADELRGAPVGWPCGEAKVAVGRAFVAPALHSPSATTFLEAASGVLDLTLPRVPGNLEASLVHQVLEDLGLALPGPRVVSDQEDWKSEDLESLLSAIAKETRIAESRGLARARSLAKALNSAWSRFQRYAFRRNDSSKASTFLLTLQSGCWLPSDGPEAALHRPGELVCGTVEIRSVFPDVQLLKGRMCGVVAGDFAEALGVLTKPTVDLATKVLLSFEHASPVAPESAVAVYGFLQEQGADWSMLRDSPCIVVEQGQAAVMPSEVVWEDPHDAIDAPKLQRLYSVFMAVTKCLHKYMSTLPMMWRDDPADISL
ncbi:unnamed protein product [Cladocopium goreaui]|uniref:Alpha-galactosidase n=1 Tax=Cladocopium goreaui TaxID=2562237 RepID=A0A9P1FGH2_9DINO|nr:unnamed protein product [Cladocopium goreaui]